MLATISNDILLGRESSLLVPSRILFVLASPLRSLRSLVAPLAMDGVLRFQIFPNSAFLHIFPALRKARRRGRLNVWSGIQSRRRSFSFVKIVAPSSDKCFQAT